MRSSFLGGFECIRDLSKHLSGNGGASGRFSMVRIRPWALLFQGTGRLRLR
ncbi:MAG: hypothetical protein IPP17_29985 [Bacteroidetes bacterium]|nr:hypothetical protein [Bacteroidota bacterium]